ncbi:MAG TPA: hypothetical protein VE548_04250 [Nitrososphaeraceae archaeon]|jgi:hypothetical protein|nr:hypothetical protein [Nitrososphaeraceae archaeon]
MSEPLFEELTRWLVKYKGRCKCCGEKVRCGEFARDQNSRVFKHMECLVREDSVPSKECLFDRKAVVELFHL